MTGIYDSNLFVFIAKASFNCVVAAGPEVTCTIINIILLYIQFMLIPSILMYSKTYSSLYILYVCTFLLFFECLWALLFRKKVPYKPN